MGGLVAGQSVRWAGTRATGRLKSPARAQQAQNQRLGATVEELVDKLGQMRGAAMKVGQMISMIDLDDLPEEQRTRIAQRLATLRDDIPPVPFSRLEKLLVGELGCPLKQAFSEFDETAFAAASIGQVHRAVTRDGAEVAVKVQYPGIAEAVDTDLRNAILLVPLLKRLAPGLDGRALVDELRERIAAELDYELEAQNHRRIERLTRRWPATLVPHVHTDLSSRRVLVTGYVEGARFGSVIEQPEAVRDRYAESVFRFFFGLLYGHGLALGDPHPGNYLLTADSQVAFFDFGLMADVTPERLAAEAAIARAVTAGDAAALKAGLVAGGYLPQARAHLVESEFALRVMRRATGWYAIPGYRRFATAATAEEAPGPRPEPDQHRDPAMRAAARLQLSQLTVPADAVLIRRMHGLVAATLMQLRAGADWGAIAGEYLASADRS